MLTIVAGPNGSGKSTFTRVLLSDSLLPVLDPDAIARRIAPATPERGAIRAGREVLRPRDLLLARRSSFVIETTLAGVTSARHIQAARAAGFRVTLVYISVEPVELYIRRVNQRVALGGHEVPELDIRRRYRRSLANLPIIIGHVDASRLFDNSGVGAATLVAEFAQGDLVYRAPVLPAWLTRSIGSMPPDPG